MGIGTALIGAGGSLLGGVAQGISDYFINQKNIAFQKEANAENIAFQRETNQANIDEARLARTLQFNREDNAVQRRTADLKAAGINPVLAAGQASQVGQVASARLNAPQVSAPRADRVQMPDVGRSVDIALSIMREKADIARSEAEKARIELETKKAGQDMDINAWNWSKAKFANVGTNASGYGKDFIDLVNFLSGENNPLSGALIGTAGKIVDTYRELINAGKTKAKNIIDFITNEAEKLPFDLPFKKK